MSLTRQEISEKIASKDAIEHHYNAGNDFYSLWLDHDSMTYTSGMFVAENDTLEVAQAQKIDYHAQQINASKCQRVLDIGCGWGGFLERLHNRYGVSDVVGLTLSSEQKAWIDANSSNVHCLLESWADYCPDTPFDGIVSIEAFEAFAKPHLKENEKIQVYREFFKKCHEWLVPGGMLALQFIPYGNASPEEFDTFISQDIFPESNFPRIAEVVQAFEYLFEIVRLENDRESYIRTLKEWRHRLKSNRSQAIDLVGEDTVRRYDRYFRISEYTFSNGNCDLFRLALRRIDAPKKINL